MDALLLCGGRGTRLDAPTEKPLFPVGGEPMVDRVRAALAGADAVDRVGLVTAPHAPRTARHVAETVRPHEHEVPTPGEGYVADLSRALRAPATEAPVLTVVADLPLLAPDAVEDVVGRYRSVAAAAAPVRPSLTVCVPVALKDALGVSADTARHHGGRDLAPTGFNVVGRVGTGDDSEGSAGGGGADGETGTAERDERLHVTHDARLAVNVNRRSDAAVAERLAAGGATGPERPAGTTDDPGGDG